MSKIYKIQELNTFLLNKTTEFAKSLSSISIVGDLIVGKIYKNNSGISFSIIDGINKFQCKMWARQGDIHQIEKLDNKNCIVTGYIKADYFYSHNFHLIVQKVETTENISKISLLKEKCIKNGYFDNKKIIDWNNIHKIGLISKKNTQGYNDFMTQNKIPIDIELCEIPLEGENTYKQCIISIEKLQTCDVIIIVRGGGSTCDISKSFDIFDLFKAIRESKIPIITAIGHEADKGDKLLITQISDLDYSTPSTAIYEINRIVLDNVIEKINEDYKIYNNHCNHLKTILYKKLKVLINETIDKKYDIPIINIENNVEKIAIKRNDKFYMIDLCLDNEIQYESNIFEIKTIINNSINDKNFEILKPKLFQLKNKVINGSINFIIDTITEQKAAGIKVLTNNKILLTSNDNNKVKNLLLEYI